jgi:hypothetical protein
MANTPQTKTQSVLDHGTSVWNYTKKILNKDLEGFKIPSWLVLNYDNILNNLHDKSIIKKYNIFHDCGKPYCHIIDEDGRSHFPNHAEVSASVWNSTFNDPVVGKLISLDMLLHTATAEEILAENLDIKDSLTLLVTALAELHSNAEMFGGINSTSFKIKWKTIDRRGNMLVKEVFK